MRTTKTLSMTLPPEMLARAEALGIREEDVDRLIHEYRQEKRARRK